MGMRPSLSIWVRTGFGVADPVPRSVLGSGVGLGELWPPLDDVAGWLGAAGGGEDALACFCPAGSQPGSSAIKAVAV